MAKDEPQSYGSQADWVKGNVGETVNTQKRAPNSQHGDFYENRHESEESAPDQGGKVSDEQLAENVHASSRSSVEETQPTTKVTDQTGGAKRGGFFKNRDYS